MSNDLFSSNGELVKPGLLRRKRVFADLDYETKLTQQQFKDDCDLNLIMKNYHEKGVVPDLVRSNPSYRDFSTVTDFMDAMNTVVKAQEQFDALPAEVRSRFSNDPALFLAFATDPKNLPEMVKLGFATEVVPTPEPTP